MFHLAIPAWEIVLRAVVIYVALFVCLRVFGKREVGQFTLYDLVLVLLVANAVQPAMTGPDSSLGGGLVIIGALVAVNFIVSRADRVPFLHRLITASPTVLVRNGRYLRQAMDKEGVDEEELAMAFREHGLEKVSEVRSAVLEEDGSISVVPKEAGTDQSKRRRRYRRRP